MTAVAGRKYCKHCKGLVEPANEGEVLIYNCDCGYTLIKHRNLNFRAYPGKSTAIYKDDAKVRYEPSYEQAQMVLNDPELIKTVWKRLSELPPPAR
jgi:hypothetical protein